MSGAAECLLPLYELMKRRVLASDVLGTDDTPVKVLDPELDHTRTGRFWAYVGDDRHPDVVYDYTTSRKRDGPQKFLKGLYRRAAGRRVQRLRQDLLRIEGQDRGSSLRCARAAEVLRSRGRRLRKRRIRRWRSSAGCMPSSTTQKRSSPEARRALRQERSLPILNDLHEWLNATLPKMRPKSPIAGAIKYSLKNWDALRRFTTDGNIPIDNNRTERTLRAQAIGRRNWMFLGSDNGGRTAAVLYSFVASAKRHHLDSEAYLAEVLRRLAPRSRTHWPCATCCPSAGPSRIPTTCWSSAATESAQAAKRRRLSRRERRRQQQAK